mmetsp:Transcript_61618/g.198461  ORF Transcript_61618/g.198461 Transcript_61618/m.198461 type:complete len:207 (-) Transcript_61618:469-1089(-)
MLHSAAWIRIPEGRASLWTHASPATPRRRACQPQLPEWRRCFARRAPSARGSRRGRRRSASRACRPSGRSRCCRGRRRCRGSSPSPWGRRTRRSGAAPAGSARSSPSSSWTLAPAWWSPWWWPWRSARSPAPTLGSLSPWWSSRSTARAPEWWPSCRAQGATSGPRRPPRPRRPRSPPAPRRRRRGGRPRASRARRRRPPGRCSLC